jgi:hypothetical protein
MTAWERVEEAAAAYVFERLDGRSLILRDVLGAAPETCDFEIQQDGDAFGVLEVTTLTDEVGERFIAALDDHGVMEDTGLWATWIVSLSKSAVEELRIKKLRERLLPVLERLEHEGITELDVRGPSEPTLEPLRDALEELSVRRVSASPPSKASRIHLVGPSPSSMVASENAHNAIQEAIGGQRMDGERRKLMRSGAFERHLFVWIMGTIFQVYVGIASDEKPSIPRLVTTSWGRRSDSA